MVEELPELLDLVLLLGRYGESGLVVTALLEHLHGPGLDPDDPAGELPGAVATWLWRSVRAKYSWPPARAS